MKRDKDILPSVENVVNKRRQRLQLITFTLLAGLLLSLPLVGCGTIFMREGKYVTPELPKSELASIQIDTTGSWIQWTNLVVLRIDGKLALREEIGENKKVSINEVLVAPGKHDMSVMVIIGTYPYSSVRLNQQTMSNFYFSAELKAGGTYLVTGKSAHRVDGGLTIELFDKNTDKVVSK